MIKILHLIKALGRGGAEVLLPETLKLHDQNRFEFFYGYFLPFDDMEGVIEKEGGKVIHFKSDGNINMLLQGEKVINFCKKNKIDIIHSHLPLAGFVARYVYSRTAIPVIYTEHNIQEKYHFATKLVNKFTYNKQTIALGVSEDVSTSIKKNINPRIPVRTLLNGVNTQFYTKNLQMGARVKAELDIPQEAIVLGNIAVFREQKALPDWIRAFAEVSKQKTDVYGLLVGAGPQEEEVKNIIRELKLENKIKLPGVKEDTLPYFSAMDIFLLSSEFEGLPIALLEAMSMECAVVSTRAGGVVEAIRDKKEGLLCEVGDFRCLARKSVELIDDEELRKSLQCSARKRVEDFFSLDIMVSRLEILYEEVISKKSLEKAFYL
ncbi:glycosyltransferase [Salinimicrobium sp. HB62]|uniref:glycosyltransferase n=1 Tax=Salinimicrobium sp. HB62 TaxID=3077781 RepID=UPI002D778DCC|nr:glycosyltransferase [Salinimicrobium sp. HB62]